MVFETLSCGSCGAKQASLRAGRFTCEFCGASVVPRFLPGTLCADGGAGFCSQPAESMCRGCARPLCTRHNDPKQLPWQGPLHWTLLIPGWSARDGADWARLNSPFQNFPVAGFEPFPWVPFLKQARYKEGVLEDKILAAVRPLFSPVGGDVTDEGCRIESVCKDCEASLGRRLDQVVREFVDRYRITVFGGGLEALRKELDAGLRYVEAFLGRPVALQRPPDVDRQTQHTDLSVASPKEEWERCGWEIKTRLALLTRLRLHVNGGKP